MTRAVLCIFSSFESELAITALVLRVWKSGQDTVAAAKAIRVWAEVEREPMPSLSIAQAYAANVIARHQDAIHSARQQEAQRA